MKFNGLNSEWLTLKVEGYQLPKEIEGYDANWLVLTVEANNELGLWRDTQPCLLTWELHWLHRWLENVVEGNVDDNISFMESELSMKYIAHAQGVHRFSVCWKSWVDENWDTRVVNLAVTNKEVELALACLKSNIDKFPPRGEQGQKGMQFRGPRIYRDII